MAPEVIRYEDCELTWLKLVNLLVLIQGWDRVNVTSSLGKQLRGFQEVSLHSPGLDWATLNRGLVQGLLNINVGFGEVHDLREVLRGKE